MSVEIHIELLPQGRVVKVPAGGSLPDLLFAEGVEFPCGGRGKCLGCRVRVLSGHLPETDDDRARLSAADRAAGWRLACQAVPRENLRLELAQWETSILSDDRTFAFTPRDGAGIAIDVGTTTLVGQLLDLRTGDVLAVESALNQQARHGADIMSRVEYGSTPEGRGVLTGRIREQLGGMIGRLLKRGEGAGRPEQVVLVGNTVMHHLFAGLDLRPLAHTPFESPHLGLQEFRPAELGWPLAEDAVVRFLPCLGGFVGSDILAGLLATRMAELEGLNALMDLGTNGEIVVGGRTGLLCTSTAAGPAFEGARIAMGMRAATGAIVSVRGGSNGGIQCHVLGAGTPRGICGSGLVDAVAVGLDSGQIRPSGRFADGNVWELLSPVALVQQDIRELQLAKAAIAAGLRLLAQQQGYAVQDVHRAHLAGAFGNYISRQSARRIGLLQVPLERVTPAGNTALLGAKLALFGGEDGDFEYEGLRRKVRHVSLHEDPTFHEVYVEEMSFPSGV